MHERAHTHEARAHARHRLNPRARAAWSRIDEAWVRARVCGCCQPAATAQQRERQYCHRSRSGGGGWRPRCGDARRRAGRPPAPAAATSAHRRSDGGALFRRRTHSPHRATASPTPPSLLAKARGMCGVATASRALSGPHISRALFPLRAPGEKKTCARTARREKDIVLCCLRVPANWNWICAGNWRANRAARSGIRGNPSPVPPTDRPTRARIARSFTCGPS